MCVYMCFVAEPLVLSNSSVVLEFMLHALWGRLVSRVMIECTPGSASSVSLTVHVKLPIPF